MGGIESIDTVKANACDSTFSVGHRLIDQPMLEMKKPSKHRGLIYGAGEEGRTPDLMLGKHTL
jgi:hypothetical protein